MKREKDFPVVLKIWGSWRYVFFFNKALLNRKNVLKPKNVFQLKTLLAALFNCQMVFVSFSLF